MEVAEKTDRVQANATAPDSGARGISESPRGSVTIDGSVLCPFSISMESLREMKSYVLPPFELRCYRTKKVLRRVDGYEGALLRDLLSIAGLGGELHDFKKTIYIARTYDGYALTFSWHELFNTPVGEKAIVAYSSGGEALHVEDGAPYLVSGADIYSGPRHMKHLSRISAHIVV